MPIKWVCKRCGLVLHEDGVKRSSYGIKFYGDIVVMYDGECPRCGHKLTPPDPRSVKIKPLTRPNP